MKVSKSVKVSLNIAQFTLKKGKWNKIVVKNKKRREKYIEQEAK